LSAAIEAVNWSPQTQRQAQENDMRPLEFGWYLPTHGDTTAYGLAEAQIAGSPELCERVVHAAEQAVSNIC
jgi:alkanesulfonate monooxygenase